MVLECMCIWWTALDSLRRGLTWSTASLKDSKPPFVISYPIATQSISLIGDDDDVRFNQTFQLRWGHTSYTRTHTNTHTHIQKHTHAHTRTDKGIDYEASFLDRTLNDFNWMWSLTSSSKTCKTWFIRGRRRETRCPLDAKNRTSFIDDVDRIDN